jgi:hypothetical protein
MSKITYSISSFISPFTSSFGQENTTTIVVKCWCLGDKCFISSKIFFISHSYTTINRDFNLLSVPSLSTSSNYHCTGKFFNCFGNYLITPNFIPSSSLRSYSFLTSTSSSPNFSISFIRLLENFKLESNSKNIISRNFSHIITSDYFCLRGITLSRRIPTITRRNISSKRSLMNLEKSK